jgi:DNA-binding NarL/FixJ family response regulator
MINAILITSDADLAKGVKAAIDGLPIQLGGVCSGMKSAMELFRGGSIRIVILDLFLPESSGLDALKLLKKIDETVLVVMITRIRMRSVIDRAFRFGASDVLPYPAGPETIRQVLLHRLELLEHESHIVFQQH